MNIPLDLLVSIFLLAIFIYLYLRLRIRMLKTYNSLVQKPITVIENFNKERTLFIGNDAHGVSVYKKDFNKSYWYQTARILIHKLEKKKNPSLLFLGLGTGAMNHIIYQKIPHSKQQIIEYDPMVILACEEYFDIKKIKNATITNTDAFKWIKLSRENFNAIVIDIYSADDFYTPGESHSLSFFKKLKFKNPKDALLIINRPIKKEFLSQDEPSIIKMIQDLNKIFLNVNSQKVYDKPRGFTNILIIAEGLRK
jgi:predicted membrane-bound spermidine synthase